MDHASNTHVTRTKYTRQRGSVLIVSLLILLVLTIIGIAAVKDTVLEEQMSSNFQKGLTAFQAAESAINVTFIEVSQSDNKYIAASNAANGGDPVQPTQRNMDRSSDGENQHANASVAMRTTVNFIDKTADTKTPEGNSININDAYPGEIYEIVATGTVSNTNVSRTHIQGVHRRLPKDGANWD